MIDEYERFTYFDKKQTLKPDVNQLYRRLYNFLYIFNSIFF